MTAGNKDRDEEQQRKLLPSTDEVEKLENGSSFAQNFGAIAIVALWICISCSMILFNKAILATMEFGFPMLLTTVHMTFAAFLTRILARFTNLLPSLKEKTVTTDIIIWKFIPIALLFSVSLVLSNTAYLYLSVSYIQMLKAFTPVAVLITSNILKLESSKYLEFVIITLICIGVAISSYGESLFSWPGFIVQTLAILAESSRLVLTNLLLRDLKLDPLTMLYYVSPLCGLFIGCAGFITEFHRVPWMLLLDVTNKLDVVLLVNCCVAFSLNVAVVLVLEKTSALVFTLAGVIKDILLIILSVVIFNAPVTLLQYLGYALALVGLNLHKEYKKDPHKYINLLERAFNSNSNST